MRTAISILLISMSTFLSAEECLLKGMWQSNKEKTLIDLEANAVSLTETQRKVFYDDFFGKLIIDNNCSSYITYFDGVVDGGDKSDFEILYEDETSVTMKSRDFTGEKVIRTLELTEDGECYSIPLGSLGFSEFFCRVN